MSSSQSLAPAELGADLLAVVARLNRVATQEARLAMPPAQLRLLAQIEDAGASRISELAAADHCSQPTMTTQVQRLEAAGWVTRRPDPADARAVLVSTTPSGSAALGAARADRAEVVTPHLAALEDAERQTLATAVRILDGLLAATGRTHTPSGTSAPSPSSPTSSPTSTIANPTSSPHLQE